MPVNAVSSASSQRIVGDLWPLVVEVADIDGTSAGVTPTVTVTLPDGSQASPAPTVESSGWCRYTAAYELTVPGRHIAAVTATGIGRADFAVQAVEATPAGRMPQLGDATSYLGETSWSSSDIQDALDAETAAQAAVCVIPAYYPPDLRDALLRRTWRNLSMRGQPFLTVPGGEDGTVSVAPSQDAEVRRLEQPHRRLLVA
jgi:hypothetical protein